MNEPARSHEDPRVHHFMAAGLAEQCRMLAEWGYPPRGGIVLENACDQRCFFCSREGIHPPEHEWTPWSAIEAHLAENRVLGLSSLCVGGNEPTRHPRFDDLLGLARDVGFTRVQLMTSGQRLAEPGALHRWISLGLAEIAFPIYAARPDVHDACTGTPGSHERLMAGLDAAFHAGLALWPHTLALRANLEHLDGLATMLCERFQATLAIAPVRAKPRTFSFRSEAVENSRLAEVLGSIRAKVTVIGFPVCFAPEVPRGGALVTEVYFRTQRGEYPPVCAPCRERAACPGVVRAHLETWGPGRLVPF